MMHRSFVVLCLTLGATCFLGCSGEKVIRREPVFSITGKITYKGMPVVGADVTFFCKEKSMSSFGKTDEQGSFRITSFVPNDGAPAGKHVITVSQINAASTPSGKKEPAVTDREYDPFKVVELANLPPPKNAIPVKYASSTTTDLFSVVNADGKNPEVVLELKD
jgi:hypothetical protein